MSPRASGENCTDEARPGLSSFSGAHGNIETWRSQVFIAPGEIKALAMSTSKFGITAKDIICGPLPTRFVADH